MVVRAHPEFRKSKQHKYLKGKKISSQKVGNRFYSKQSYELQVHILLLDKQLNTCLI